MFKKKNYFTSGEIVIYIWGIFRRMPNRLIQIVIGTDEMHSN